MPEPEEKPESGSGSRGTGRAAAGMGAATALSRGIGFIRVLTIAAVLGTTYLGNAYQSSNAVSNILFELLAAGALSALRGEPLEPPGREDARQERGCDPRAPIPSARSSAEAPSRPGLSASSRPD